MADKNDLPVGTADDLVRWLADMLNGFVEPQDFWLSLHAANATVEAPTWYNQACAAGNCWRISISDNSELILALAKDPHLAATTLIDPLFALFANQLERLLPSASACWQQLALHQRMLDAITSSVIGMDLDGYITSWNRGAEQMFGYPKAEAIGRHILFLYADEDEENNLLEEAFNSGCSREILVQRKRRDGSIFWASIHFSLLLDDAGNPEGLIGYLTDGTERVRAEEKLIFQSAVFEFSGEAIMVTDDQGHVVSVNRAFSRIFDITTDELIGGDFSFLYHRQYGEDFWTHVRGEANKHDRWMGEMLCCRKDGSSLPSWVSLSSVRNIEGQLTHYIVMLTDISERQQAKETIHQLAYFDSLTGLPNRAMVKVLLNQAIEQGKRSHAHGALLLLDIDRFKRVNDALGVSAGDELLVQLANRLRGALRAEDVVARCGPDEYVIGLFDIAAREHASIIALKLLRSIREPFTLSLRAGQEEILNITASIGVVVFPDDGNDPDTLLRHASIAMGRVRQMEDVEDQYLFFSNEMNDRARERHQLEEDLRYALGGRELMLHLQPQFDLATGEMLAAEALLRWQHRSQGMISPAKFIPIAEETGLIVELGDWVLETACATLRDWMDRSLRPVRLAVNLSARQIRPKLESRVMELLAKYQLSPQLLELEITESVLLTDNEQVLSVLENLHRQGFMIALDDFGTGYSSLAYLRRLPIDTLKIDRSFIIDLPGGEQESALVLSILDLARNHGLAVVAEGVETTEQLAFLREHGCQLVQGFLLGRPVPLDVFETGLSAV